MAKLVKHYPDAPQKNRIVCTGDVETLKAHLNEIEARTNREQLSKCGTVYTEFIRIDDFTLLTCVYKNIDTEDEETIDINFYIFL